MDGPREHVAAEPVGAEQIVPARRLQPQRIIADQRIELGEGAWKCRGQK